MFFGWGAFTIASTLLGDAFTINLMPKVFNRFGHEVAFSLSLGENHAPLNVAALTLSYLGAQLQ